MNFEINVEKLGELLKDFYTLTKIRIVVFGKNYEEIISYPNHHSSYCEILRRCPKALEKCALCDKEACIKSKQAKGIVIYQCHAGLVEAVTPIRYEDMVIGYMMFGQVLQTKDFDKSWEETLPKLANFDVDIQELKQSFYKRKNLSEDKIHAASRIMQACAGYLYLSKMISLKKDSLESRISQYISTHLTDDLSVDRLCEVFSISKTHLYEIAEYNYGCGIAEHIRACRMELAKQLLLDTDKSINEIAALCGVPDYNYFTKIFKRYYGITPREYRRKSKS